MAQDLSNTPPPPPGKSLMGSILKGLLVGAVIGAAVAALLFIHPVAIAIAGAHLLGGHSFLLAHTHAAHAASFIAKDAIWPVLGIATGAGAVLAGAGNLISKAMNHHKAAQYEQAQEQQYQQQLAMDSQSLAVAQAPSYPETSVPQRSWQDTVAQQGMGINNGRSM